MGGAERGVAEVSRGYQIEIAKLAIFSGEAGKMRGFVTACRLYLRMKMREATVEEQVFWVLSHMQGGSADVWKENIMEELESGEMEYETVEEFLTVLKKEFRGGGRRSSKSGGTKEARARREDNGGICAGVQADSEREWV